jgi:hypothetical protein
MRAIVPPGQGRLYWPALPFHTMKNHHLFCRHCGVRSFGIGNDTPMGQMIGVNLGCLNDVTDEELSKVPITYIDGLNDRPSALAFFAHL